MTQAEYDDYKGQVARYLHGLEAISTGPCHGCKECAADDAEDPWFSKHPCEICNGMAGNRQSWHARNPEDNNAIVHGTCCEDCAYFLEYGILDDTTMIGLKE